MTLRDDMNTLIARERAYGIDVRVLMDEALGHSAGNAVYALRKAGDMAVHPIYQRLSLYTLGRKYCARHGLPRERSELPGEQALHTALARLWYCHLHPNFHPVCIENARAAFGYSGPLLKEFSSRAHVWVLYCPSPETTTSSTVKGLASKIKTVKTTKLAGWLDPHAEGTQPQAGFLMLVHNDYRKAAVEKALSTRRSRMMTRGLIVRVAVSPITIPTLPLVLKEFRIAKSARADV